MTSTDSGSARGSLLSYCVGFGLSIVCTLLAFWLVQWNMTHHVFDQGTVILFVLLLAITQLICQLIFFLHLGSGSDRNWNAAVFGFAVLIVAIVVGGSLWIMSNLKHTSLNDMYIKGIVTPANQEN